MFKIDDYVPPKTGLGGPRPVREGARLPADWPNDLAYEVQGLDYGSGVRDIVLFLDGKRSQSLPQGAPLEENPEIGYKCVEYPKEYNIGDQKIRAYSNSRACPEKINHTFYINPQKLSLGNHHLEICSYDTSRNTNFNNKWVDCVESNFKVIPFVFAQSIDSSLQGNTLKVNVASRKNSSGKDHSFG